MTGRIWLAIGLLTVAASAQARLEIGVGQESYRWVEQPTGASGPPTESGMRSALFLDWNPEREHGLMFAGRAKLYGGTVNYDTYTLSTGTPVSTQTDYSGSALDLSAFYRAALGIDYLAGLGLDSWQRNIRNGGASQIENYSIIFLRAGLRIGNAGRNAGLHGEFGAKYPFATREDAHLTGMGYTSNPLLAPRGRASGYAELGYRFSERLDLVGYYDSWRFDRSPNVTVTDTAGASWYIYQPQSSMDTAGLKLLLSF